MASKFVLCTDGNRREITVHSVTCPCCGTMVEPIYLCCQKKSGIIFSQCPVSGCEEYFLVKEWVGGLAILPNHSLSKQTFSDIIDNVSSSFGIIYNEAFTAEQMNLMEICGVGYRKALEFLIKDYTIQSKDGQTVDIIKKMPLAKCIDEYVDDAKIKAVAKRAVWLGNDETHYVRKWEEKDVQDLKGLIRLTTLWIEKEKETEILLAEMPEGR